MGTFKVCNREYPWHARLFPWTLFAGSRGGNPRGKSCFSLGAQRFSRGGFSSFSHPRLKDREPIPARSGNGVSAGWMKMKRVTSEILKEPLRKAGILIYSSSPNPACMLWSSAATSRKPAPFPNGFVVMFFRHIVKRASSTRRPKAVSGLSEPIGGGIAAPPPLPEICMVAGAIPDCYLLKKKEEKDAHHH